MNLILVSLCAVVLLLSYKNLMRQRCSHREFDPVSIRCWNCGIGYRTAMFAAIRGRGVSVRESKWVLKKGRDNPYVGMCRWVYFMNVETPDDPAYAYKEVECLHDDAPPEIRERWETLVGRR